MRPHTADRAGGPVFLRFVAVAQAQFAAFRLEKPPELWDDLVDFRPHERRHLAELPLRPGAEPVSYTHLTLPTISSV